MILSYLIQATVVDQDGEIIPTFPEFAVISQLREVRTGTARSVSPVRLNQGAFLAFMAVE